MIGRWRALQIAHLWVVELAHLKKCQELKNIITKIHSTFVGVSSFSMGNDSGYNFVGVLCIDGVLTPLCSGATKKNICLSVYLSNYPSIYLSVSIYQ